jgi:hypothetical protein
LPVLGGNPNVLIAKPDVKVYKYTNKTDFIMMGCDGIFDVLSNTDVIHSIWSTVGMPCKDIHEQAARCTDNIVRNCLGKGAIDNLTCVLIAFDNFKQSIFDEYETVENLSYVDINRDLRNLKDCDFKPIEEYYALFSSKVILPDVGKYNFLTPNHKSSHEYYNGLQISKSSNKLMIKKRDGAVGSYDVALTLPKIDNKY